MTIDWREELKRMEEEKAILDRAFEEGRLCWYKEPWEEEDDYSAEDLQEVVHYLWEEEEEEDEKEEERDWYKDLDEKWQDFYWSTVVRW